MEILPQTIALTYFRGFTKNPKIGQDRLEKI